MSCACPLPPPGPQAELDHAAATGATLTGAGGVVDDELEGDDE